MGIGAGRVAHPPGPTPSRCRTKPCRALGQPTRQRLDGRVGRTERSASLAYGEAYGEASGAASGAATGQHAWTAPRRPVQRFLDFRRPGQAHWLPASADNASIKNAAEAVFSFSFRVKSRPAYAKPVARGSACPRAGLMNGSAPRLGESFGAALPGLRPGRCTANRPGQATPGQAPRPHGLARSRGRVEADSAGGLRGFA